VCLRSLKLQPGVTGCRKAPRSKDMSQGTTLVVPQSSFIKSL
jgi:hypothetical protein